MKEKIKYTHEPLGELKRVVDILPPPHKLVFKEPEVQVTLSLTKRSVQTLKKIAKDNQLNYSLLIRQILDLYTLQHY